MTLSEATPRDQSVILKWVDPENSDIDSFEYSYHAGDDNYTPWTKIENSTATTTQHPVAELTNGTTYTFRVQARTAGGVGGGANTLSATPDVVPPQPTIVSFYPGDTIVHVYFSVPSYEHVDYWEYRLKRKSDENYPAWAPVSQTVQIPPSAPHLRYVQAMGLENDVTYVGQLRAVNGEVRGDPSVEGEATPHVWPDAPADFAVTPSDKKVTLSWTNPLNAHITHYQYERDGDDNWQDLTLTTASDATTLQADVSGLTNGTEYSFKIRAVTLGWYGSQTEAVTATPDIVPPKPTIVSFSPGDTTVDVTFGVKSYEHVTGWEYRFKKKSDENYPAWKLIDDRFLIPIGGNRQLQATRLENDTTYVGQIRAVNGEVRGDPSDEDEATPHAQPDAPTDFAVTPSHQKVTLSWTNPQSVSVTGYEYEQDGDGTWTDLTLTSDDRATKQEADITGLTNGKEYSFKVRAVTPVFNGKETEAVKATPDIVPAQADNCQFYAWRHDCRRHLRRNVV